MAPPLVIGVLALQGAFAKHAEVLRSLGAKVVEVRKPADLLLCDGLVMPGGESTAMMKQMEFIKLKEPFEEFSQQKPIFGTCAGLILMSQHIIGDKMQPFHLLDIDVERNAFGRQAESFKTTLEIRLKANQTKEILAVFIRAPRIRQVSDKVTVLAKWQEEPVLVQQGFHLGASFHPELTHDPAIHAYFLTLVKDKLKFGAR